MYFFIDFGCFLSGSTKYDLFSTTLTSAMISSNPQLTVCGPYATGIYLAYNSLMTNEMCISFCYSKGFIYSGTLQKYNNLKEYC